MLLLVVTLFHGCVPSKPAEEEKVIPADRLIKKLEANRRKIKTFRGTGVINVNASAMSAKANFEVELKKPDSVKISIYGPFGIDLAHALLTKNSFVFYDVMNNQVYKGRSRKGLIEKIFKVDISFDDLMDALTGAVNLTDKLREEPDKYKIGDNEFELGYVDSLSNKESIYKVNADNLAITDFSIFQPTQTLVFNGNYKDFKVFDEVPIPYKIDIKYLKNDQSMNIEYRSIQVNKLIDDMKVTIPDDANVNEW